MANYRTITVGVIFSDHIASACASVADMVIAAGASIATDIHTSDLPIYDGAYEVTPTQDTQILATEDRQMTGDIIIHPIPSNYGLITWNGSTLTVS